MHEYTIEGYRESWAARVARRKKSLEDRKHVLLDLARQCATVLREKFHVQEIILIGSLARPGNIHERTDIDLAVRGLPGDQYFRALSVLYDFLPEGVEVDVITLESATPVMSTIVATEGIVL